MTTALMAQAATGNEGMLLWAFVLVGVAGFLLFLELFVPSGGILAIAGAASVVGSIVCFFLHSTTAGLVALGIGIVFGPVLVWLVFRWWIDSPLGRRMILGGDQMDLDRTSEEAYAASAHEREQRASRLSMHIGQVATAETPLRPVGVVRLGDQRLEALSEHGIIEAGQSVIVTDAYDNQLKVRPAGD
ncbi:MAG: hypothetical protein MK116_02405 [Phycisphaerales bacterium]|nr:hypothetical protein [Phycisphaerales bacterium]